jgi:hypothetical protein
VGKLGHGTPVHRKYDDAELKSFPVVHTVA